MSLFECMNAWNIYLYGIKHIYICKYTNVLASQTENKIYNPPFSKIIKKKVLIMGQVPITQSKSEWIIFSCFITLTFVQLDIIYYDWRSKDYIYHWIWQWWSQTDISACSSLNSENIQFYSGSRCFYSRISAFQIDMKRPIRPIKNRCDFSLQAMKIWFVFQFICVFDLCDVYVCKLLYGQNIYIFLNIIFVVFLQKEKQV